MIFISLHWKSETLMNPDYAAIYNFSGYGERKKEKE